MTGYLRRHTLVFGTLVLTAAGLLSRVLGFFYRIFLSRTIGAEGIGVYQMIFPIYGICFSLCAGSIQTAISRLIAAHPGRSRQILFTGLSVSISMSLLLAGLISGNAEWISVHILLEPRCEPLLPTLAVAIPFTAIQACIRGYYYGKEQVHVPALAQLIEQCVRILTVFLVASLWNAQGKEITNRITVIALLTGEMGAALFSVLTCACSAVLAHVRAPHIREHSADRAMADAPKHLVRSLMALALPLMANRLIMNVLQSAEAILIPNQLALFGLTESQALSIYGVLTGMAIPFIMFPSAIINSLAVVLLPMVARHQSTGNDSGIQKSISISFRYSLSMGILCIGIFVLFGDTLGETIFHSGEAGAFITILAWLCPFLYLATTAGSILNGLGHMTMTFVHNVISLVVRLLFVLFGIPRFGILACLWGMLAGEILLAALHLYSLYRLEAFPFDAWNTIAVPVGCLMCSLCVYQLIPETLTNPAHIPVIVETFLRIGFICLFYGLLLLFFQKNE